MNNDFSKPKHDDTVKRGKNRTEDRGKRSQCQAVRNALKNWEDMDEDDSVDLE